MWRWHRFIYYSVTTLSKTSTELLFSPVISEVIRQQQHSSSSSPLLGILQWLEDKCVLFLQTSSFLRKVILLNRYEHVWTSSPERCWYLLSICWGPWHCDGQTSAGHRYSGDSGFQLKKTRIASYMLGLLSFDFTYQMFFMMLYSPYSQIKA